MLPPVDGAQVLMTVRNIGLTDDLVVAEYSDANTQSTSIDALSRSSDTDRHRVVLHRVVLHVLTR